MDTQLQNAVAYLDHLLAAQTVAADEETYMASVVSDFRPAQAQGARFMRGKLAQALGAGRSVLGPVLSAYAHHVVGTPERTAQRALDRIYQYFEDNNKHVVSRGVTYGTPTSFSAGKGQLYRLTVDENGYDLEAAFMEVKTVKCLRDENTGANRYEEVFEFRGANAGIDALDATGSGQLRQDRTAKTSNHSLLKNSTFSSYSIAGSFSSSVYTLVSGDSVSGWTFDDLTNVTLDQNTAGIALAGGVVGDATPTALRFDTNAVATQAFSVQGIRLNAARPYILSCWVKPNAALTAGTLTITWGSKTQAFDLSTLTAGSYNFLILDQDKDLWPASFSQADSEIVFTFTSLDSTCHLDEVYFGPMEPFDGTWFHLRAGTTKFLLDDKITVTDALTSSDSKIQKWLWRAYARHLPHVAAATQITAAAGRTLTFADSGGSDTITASSGSFISDGYKVGMLVTVAGTTSNNGTTGAIATVTATVLTFGSDTTLSAEGPLSATATLDATANIPDPS